MKESVIENQLETELIKQGYIVKRNARVGRWEADFVIETPEKSRTLVELKNRQIGIPDVLSVASMANNMSGPFQVTSGSIVTTDVPTRTVLQAALDNNVEVWIVKEPQELVKKAMLATMARQLYMRLRKLSNEKITDKSVDLASVTDGLCARNVIDESVCRELEWVQVTRDKVTNGSLLDEAELDEANNKATKLLKKF